MSLRIHNTHPECACLGKEAYASKSEADAVANQIKRRAKKHSARPQRLLAAYKCEHCPSYHIGNNFRTLGRVGK